MRVYAGHVGGERALAQLRRYGMGRWVCTSTWRAPAPGIPWALDNGAFQAYRRGKTLDEDAFLAALSDEAGDHGKVELAGYGHENGWPDFAVLPDIPMGGTRSLEFSLSWADRLPATFRWVLPVQDGVTMEDVEETWDESEEMGLPLSGIFVGGSREFKLATTERAWVPFARERDAVCHVGRVSTMQGLAWAERVGVTSVDSAVFGIAFAYARVQAAREQSRLADFDGGARRRVAGESPVRGSCSTRREAHGKDRPRGRARRGTSRPEQACL